MPKTDKKPLELGRPRATAYMEILTKRLGKRKAAVIEGRARELAEQADERVVRFEYVAEAAGVPIPDMLAELEAVGIKTRPKDVRVTVASTNGAAKKEAAKPAGKGGPGNARKTTPARSSSKTAAKKRPAPTPRPKTKAGSGKQSASSRKASARKGRAASSSASPKTDQLRRLREKQASAAR